MAAFLAVVIAALTLAACGSSPSAAPSSTSTTTTTTLPVPVSLSATAPQGSFASLGVIKRITVPLLAPPALSAPAGQGLEPYSAGTSQVAYRQFGSGPDLLLIMGQHGTMTWWDPQLLTDLAGHFTVTIFDLPGVGYSSPLASTPSAESDADVTAGLVSMLALTHPVVLGWGLGGTIALALAERHPGVLQRLVLVDSTAGGPDAPPVRKAVAAAFASPNATLGALAQIIFSPAATDESTAWLDRVLELSPDDIVSRAITDEATIASGLEKSTAISGHLGQVEVPVLVIAGGADAVIPEANAPLLAAALPHAKLIVEANAGYAVLSQDESVLLPELVAFATAPR